MRAAIIVVAALATSACMANHPVQTAPTPKAEAQADFKPVSITRGQRSIFADSALHALKCERPKAGEDWRQVCVPKDQSFR